MAQLWKLTLTDNVETVNFISDPVYFVEDGEFNIGMPSVRRELAPIRSGFYIPVLHEIEYREASIKFQVRGATRTAVLSSIQKIERILRNIAAQVRLSAGRRGELSYSWEGSINVTYFEVYGGTVKLPDDALSVEKMYATENGSIVLPEVELTLYMSGMGYGLSLFSEPTLEIPLLNPSVGAKQTGGVRVQNAWTSGQNNYVELNAVDLPGSLPLITKIQLASDTPYSAWRSLFMGLQQSPYPTGLFFDSANTAQNLLSGTEPANANASGGSYKSFSWGSPLSSSALSKFGWSLGNSSVGTFFAFYNAFNAIPQDVQLAVGIEDYSYYGIRQLDEFTGPVTTGIYSLPLGVVNFPPGGAAVSNAGTLMSNILLSIWVTSGQASSLTLDHVTLLPMANGLRVWNSRSPINASTGSFIDDGWRGIEYVKNVSNQILTPFYGLMEPLKLEPNVTQRIYFNSVGLSYGTTEASRAFVVRVYAVPTYSTLAL